MSSFSETFLSLGSKPTRASGQPKAHLSPKLGRKEKELEAGLSLLEAHGARAAWGAQTAPCGEGRGGPWSGQSHHSRHDLGHTFYQQWSLGNWWQRWQAQKSSPHRYPDTSCPVS